MKSYLAVFSGTALTLFMIIWAFVGFDFQKIAATDYWLARPHVDMISKCDLGDIVIIGDSTAMADFIPSRIGPGVRDVGFNGGSPVEVYSVVESILKCSHLPKTVIMSFIPGQFSGDQYFWPAFKYGVANVSDALQVLKVSRMVDAAVIAGPESLFDIDFRIKAFLYSIKFPPYYATDIETYISGRLQKADLTNPALNSTIYDQVILDDGHHFIGTKAAEKNVLDIDANRSGKLISPLTEFYLRRMIEAFASKGITVYFVEPPRNRISAIHYPPNLIDTFQSNLLALQHTESNFHIINNGFNIWNPELFGDKSHLNLRGALILSHDLNVDLDEAGESGLIFSGTDLEPVNLYALASAKTAFWMQPSAGDASEIGLASNISLPDLAYPGGLAWLYNAPAMDRHGIQAADIGLDAKTNYAASVFVKDVNASRAKLGLNWPGGTSGSVSWDFNQRQISYAGSANELNSGVTICPGGWVQLYLSATTGPQATSYSGPVVSLPGRRAAAAYLSNPALERGLWPTNYCTLQPGEAETVPLP